MAVIDAKLRRRGLSQSEAIRKRKAPVGGSLFAGWLELPPDMWVAVVLQLLQGLLDENATMSTRIKVSCESAHSHRLLQHHQS